MPQNGLCYAGSGYYCFAPDGADLRDALRLSGLHNTFSPAVLPRTHAKKPIRQDGLLHFI
jgi:hypothetical protein